MSNGNLQPYIDKLISFATSPNYKTNYLNKDEWDKLLSESPVMTDRDIIDAVEAASMSIEIDYWDVLLDNTLKQSCLLEELALKLMQHQRRANPSQFPDDIFGSELVGVNLNLVFAVAKAKCRKPRTLTELHNAIYDDFYFKHVTLDNMKSFFQQLTEHAVGHSSIVFAEEITQAISVVERRFLRRVYRQDLNKLFTYYVVELAGDESEE